MRAKLPAILYSIFASQTAALTGTATAAVQSHEAALRLRTSLEAATKRNIAEAILLSGGLDTSIVATLASRLGPLASYTVALEKASAPDLEYASLIARTLRLRHNVRVFTLKELMRAVPDVVRTLRVFDPMEIRNSVAVYLGLAMARTDGTSAILTGDGCDELFAGYSFLFNLDPPGLKAALERLWKVMSFSSIPMARGLGIEAKLPFLDPEFKNLAMHVDPSLLVVEDRGTKWGKWIVRKAFEDLLPAEITWRVKTPIEYGCGTTILPKVFDEMISNEEFAEQRQRILRDDRVTIRDKEHLVYYQVFRETVGLKERTSEGRNCPQCNFSVPEGTNFCRTCGAYPI